MWFFSSRAMPVRRSQGRKSSPTAAGHIPEMRVALQIIAAVLAISKCWSAPASDVVVYIDFTKTNQGLTLRHDLTVITGRFGGALEFKNPLQVAELSLAKQLDKAQAATVGGWFYPRRSGEQYLIARGMPETGANGERLFRRRENWLNFVLGTDHRGFFLGIINGNSF